MWKETERPANSVHQLPGPRVNGPSYDLVPSLCGLGLRPKHILEQRWVIPTVPWPREPVSRVSGYFPPQSFRAMCFTAGVTGTDILRRRNYMSNRMSQSTVNPGSYWVMRPKSLAGTRLWKVLYDSTKKLDILLALENCRKFLKWNAKICVWERSLRV